MSHCSCCGSDREDPVALRCRDDVRICRSCIGWLRSQAKVVDATPILPAGDMESAVVFYERAGFQVREYEGGGYAFVHYEDESVFDPSTALRPRAQRLRAAT